MSTDQNAIIIHALVQRIATLETRPTKDEELLREIRQLCAAVKARGDGGRLLPRVEKIEALLRGEK